MMDDGFIWNLGYPIFFFLLLRLLLLLLRLPSHIVNLQFGHTYACYVLYVSGIETYLPRYIDALFDYSIQHNALSL